MNDFYEPDEDPATVNAVFEAGEKSTTRTPTIRRKQATAKLRETIASKLDEHFRDRTFDIVREIHLGDDEMFLTVLGSRARHGYILRDRATGEEIAVGATLLRIIHDRYLGVNLPYKPRRRRAKTA